MHLELQPDIRGIKTDPQQYFVQPPVNQSTTLLFALIVKDSYGTPSQNVAVTQAQINPCNQGDLNEVKKIEDLLKSSIDDARFLGMTLPADTLELWMTGRGALLYPMDHPKILSPPIMD